MCLDIIAGEHAHLGKTRLGNPRALIATKDIKVYKILNRNASPYFDFEYKPNTLYKSRLVVSTSYISRNSYVENGLHAFLTRLGAFDRLLSFYDNPCRVVMMTIPKGSKYFLGFRNEIVSNQVHSGTLSTVRK